MIRIWTLVVCMSVTISGRAITEDGVKRFLVDLSLAAVNPAMVQHLQRGGPNILDMTIIINRQNVTYDEVKEAIGFVCENQPFLRNYRDRDGLAIGCSYLANLAAGYLSALASAQHGSDVPLSIDGWNIRYNDIKYMFPKVCSDPANALYQSLALAEPCSLLIQDAIALLRVFYGIVPHGTFQPLSMVLQHRLQRYAVSGTYDQLKVMMGGICDSALHNVHEQGVTGENIHWIKPICVTLGKKVFATLAGIGHIFYNSRTQEQDIVNYNNPMTLHQAAPFMPKVCKKIENIGQYFEDESFTVDERTRYNVGRACRGLLQQHMELLRE